MYRRLCFLLSVCGIVLIVLPFAGVMPHADFVALVVGCGCVVLGVFAAIESVAPPKTRQP